MKILMTAGTDVGKLRTNNEDAFCCRPNLDATEARISSDYIAMGKWGCLSVVADGMGGPVAGELASSIAIAAIREFFSGNRLSGAHDKESFLKEAVKYANDAILQEVKTNGEATGMGTTLVLLWIVDNRAYVAWVGDSRGYVFHLKTGMRVLTKDHSYVQELIDKGEISPKDALTHPDSNIITRGLGDLDVSAQPDIVSCQVEDGDIFLLCSDGLCGYVPDEVIERILCHYFRDIPSCCTKLIQCGLHAGGEDNITVALVATAPDHPYKSQLGLLLRLRSFFSPK